jgi:hypothetical protein
MKLRAPPHAGDPSVGGIVIKPDTKGFYDVDHETARVLIESFGFSDAAAKKPPVIAAPTADADDIALRSAVVGLLNKFGIKTSSPAAVLSALGDLPKIIDARLAAETKSDAKAGAEKTGA